MEGFKNFELLLLTDGNSKPITRINGKYYNTSLDSESVKGYKDGAEHFSLYLFSDEEIKEGDWVYYEDDKIVFQCKHSSLIGVGEYKIIATTDKSLNLPKFSYDLVGSIVTALNTNINLVGINVKVNKKGNVEVNQSEEIIIKNLISVVK